MEPFVIHFCFALLIISYSLLINIFSLEFQSALEEENLETFIRDYIKECIKKMNNFLSILYTSISIYFGYFLIFFFLAWIICYSLSKLIHDFIPIHVVIHVSNGVFFSLIISNIN